MVWIWSWNWNWNRTSNFSKVRTGTVTVKNSYGSTTLPIVGLKGTVSRDFLLQVFFMIHLPQAPDNNIRIISNFFENSRRYSKVKVHAPPVSTTPVANCRRYQRHRRQILRPVPLVLLTPVANNWNNIRLQ
jgi:hypothetical protein